MDLSVNIQLGHAAAGRVVGKADRDGLGAVRQRHRDLKQLQREKKSKKLLLEVQIKAIVLKHIGKTYHEFKFRFFVFQLSIIPLNNCYVQNEYNSYGMTTNIFNVKLCYMPVCLLQHLTYKRKIFKELIFLEEMTSNSQHFTKIQSETFGRCFEKLKSNIKKRVSYHLIHQLHNYKSLR